MNEERNDFQARLLLIMREAEALLDTLAPGVSRTRAQHIATTARLLHARLDVAAALILLPADGSATANVNVPHAGSKALAKVITSGRKLLIRLVQNYGADRVAARLGLSQALLQQLLTGSVQVPDNLLIRAVDVLLETAEPPPLTAPAVRPATKQ